MMRFEDKVKWLSGALVVLLLVWGLGEFFSPERVAARDQTSTLLAGKADQASDILITSGSATAHLSKQGGVWKLMDGSSALPVQSSRVDALLSALASSARRMPVAKSKDSWKSLGLDDQRTKSLKVSDAAGKALLDLKAGDRGPTGSGLYVRLAGSDTSYLVQSDISSWLVADHGSWLDLRIWKDRLTSDAVQSVAATSDLDFASQAASTGAKAKTAVPHVSWKFDRTKDGWEGAKGLEEVTIESMIRAALNLEAVDLAAQAPAGAFDKIGAKMTLILGTGKTKVIEVGASAGDGRWWVRATDGGQLLPLSFQVSSWSLGALFKSEASFQKKQG